MLCCVLLCLAARCVLLCLVLSCRVLLCPVVSCCALFCLAVSCRESTYEVLRYLVSDMLNFFSMYVYIIIVQQNNLP